MDYKTFEDVKKRVPYFIEEVYSEKKAAFGIGLLSTKRTRIPGGKERKQKPSDRANFRGTLSLAMWVTPKCTRSK